MRWVANWWLIELIVSSLFLSRVYSRDIQQPCGYGLTNQPIHCVYSLEEPSVTNQTIIIQLYFGEQ